MWALNGGLYYGSFFLWDRVLDVYKDFGQEVLHEAVKGSRLQLVASNLTKKPTGTDTINLGNFVLLARKHDVDYLIETDILIYDGDGTVAFACYLYRDGDKKSIKDGHRLSNLYRAEPSDVMFALDRVLKYLSKL